jgi:hypothetical protein
MKIPVLLLLGMALLSCMMFSCNTEAGKDAPPHRYADLFIRYLDGENQLKATASFLEGDTLENATSYTPGQGIQFQGEAMQARPLPGGTRYLLETRAPYASSYIFTADFMPEFQISMPAIDSFGLAGGQGSLSSGLQLYVDHPPGKSESLVLFFSDANNQAYTLIVEGPVDGQVVKLSPSELKQLKPGTHELYLVKKKKVTEEKERFSVLANIEYYTQPVSFELSE